MTDELLAYLLDDLTPEGRTAVEAHLERDQAWRHELERLKACLAATGDPARCGEDPPRDLVTKTCCLVKRAGEPAARSAATASFAAAAPCDCETAAWSRSDLIVGGGVALLLAMLVLPALRESRDASRQLVCQNNLRNLGLALFAYQENHNHRLPNAAPGRNAGMFVLDLVDEGVVSRRQLTRWLLCPESQLAEDVAQGRVVFQIPTRARIVASQGDQLAQLLATMAGAYAYRLGYFDKQNEYHVIPFTGDANEPMLADAPRLLRSGVRSANHGGCGQWIAYQDLSVRFRTNCDLDAGIDNIYLNWFGMHAAGRGQGDIVMGVSSCDANGPIVPIDAAR
jgi:hypothetical protein